MPEECWAICSAVTAGKASARSGAAPGAPAAWAAVTRRHSAAGLSRQGPVRPLRQGPLREAKGQVRAEDGPDPGFGARLDVLERAVQAVPVGQRERGHAKLRRPGDQRRRGRRAEAQRV
jgi:hypothetical protein